MIRGSLNGIVHYLATDDETVLEKFAEAMDTTEYVR